MQLTTVPPNNWHTIVEYHYITPLLKANFISVYSSSPHICVHVMNVFFLFFTSRVLVGRGGICLILQIKSGVFWIKEGSFVHRAMESGLQVQRYVQWTADCADNGMLRWGSLRFMYFREHV